jgi:hypothetical protein
MEQKKDYTQFTFKPNEQLEVAAPILGILRQFAEEVLNKEGVGVFRATSPRFEYLHKEKGTPAKTGMAKAKLEKDYSKVFSLEKTIAANTDEFLLDLGKRALSVINLLNSVHKDNVDSGKAILRSELEAEMAAEKVNGQVQQLPTPTPVQEKATIILDTVQQEEEE